MNIRDKIKSWVLNSVAASHLCSIGLRKRIYSFYGHRVNKIYSECFMGYGNGHLLMGKNSYCNSRCFFDLGNDIIIGDNCSIAFNVTFINSTHEIGSCNHRAGGGISFPIFVGNGCWIGANVTIMPNVKIGDGCIIAAGSVVIDDCIPNGLYVGVPAKRIKDLCK